MDKKFPKQLKNMERSEKKKCYDSFYSPKSNQNNKKYDQAYFKNPKRTQKGKGIIKLRTNMILNFNRCIEVKLRKDLFLN